MPFSKASNLLDITSCLQSVIGSTIVIPEVSRQSQALAEESRYMYHDLLPEI